MLNENHKELISMGLTIGIICLTLFIAKNFITSIVWAAIIGIATYPLYVRWRTLFLGFDNTSALVFTLLIGLLLLLPLSWLLGILVKETQLFVNFLQHLNKNGDAAPGFLKNFPFINNELVAYWDENIGKPGSLRHLLSNWHLSLSPTGYYIKTIGFSLAHKSFQVGFTLLTLFFFYRDGDKLLLQIHHVGEYCLGERWFRYADKLPKALRSTVNGTIVVGIGVGVLMGILLCACGFSCTHINGIHHRTRCHDSLRGSNRAPNCSPYFIFNQKHHRCSNRGHLGNHCYVRSRPFHQARPHRWGN